MPHRIVLLGRAGAGKTSLSRRLGELTGEPVICLDEIWEPGWTAADVPEFRLRIAAAHESEAWISDGNFAEATFDLRLARATLILWLDAPRSACTWRAMRRVWQPGETHRARNLVSVLRFIWRFDRVNRPKIEAAIRRYGPDVPMRRLDGAREVGLFVEEVRTQALGE